MLCTKHDLLLFCCLNADTFFRPQHQYYRLGKFYVEKNFLGSTGNTLTHCSPTNRQYRLFCSLYQWPVSFRYIFGYFSVNRQIPPRCVFHFVLTWSAYVVGLLFFGFGPAFWQLTKPLLEVFFPHSKKIPLPQLSTHCIFQCWYLASDIFSCSLVGYRNSRIYFVCNSGKN